MKPHVSQNGIWHCEQVAKDTEEKILCRSPISKRSPLSDFRRAIKQGKGRSSKRKENRRLSFLFAPAAGAALSRAPQSATPSLNFSEKLSARKGRTRLRQFVCPGFPVQKRSRPVRANTPAAVRAPRLSGAEKEPPCQGEHARAVCVPRSAGAENKSRV